MKDINASLLRFPQREQLQTDIENAETMLPHAKPDDRGTIVSNIQKSKKQLHAQSPEPLTGKEKDTLAALEKKLLARITTNMPTEEVMRKNPAGAVDWHTKWEKANKKIIRMWKNIRIQLNPDNSDKDLANIERYRPSGVSNRIRTDAQISGSMSYSDLPEELWPFDPPKNTALEQVKRVTEVEVEDQINKALDEFDGEELDSQVGEDGEVDGRKVPISPERHAILVQRLADARAAKKKKAEEEQQLEETLQAVPEK